MTINMFLQALRGKTQREKRAGTTEENAREEGSKKLTYSVNLRSVQFYLLEKIQTETIILKNIKRSFLDANVHN